MAVPDGRSRVLAGSRALILRRVRVRQRLVAVAFFMRCDGLKVVVRRCDVARGGEVMLVARHLNFGICHESFSK
jgi:hypothetical protein